MLNKVVILSGDYNNAGDFLIKYKTEKIFRYFLPNSELVFINRNRPFEDKLDVINSADLLVIAGGPAIFANVAETMNISPILDKITVPIIMFGVGLRNNCLNFNNFKLVFTEESKKLMDRIEKASYFSTVRDLQSVRFLKNYGYTNFKFSGCPVMYDLDSLDKEYKRFAKKDIKKVVFSCGAPNGNKLVMRQQFELIKYLKKYFSDKEFVVAFHHCADIEKYKSIYFDNKLYFKLINNIKNAGIETVDISEDHKKMIDLYSSSDLHIGYRVHAHIFMTSVKKHSLLILEDGRGKSISEIIGGTYFNSFEEYYKTYLTKEPKLKRKYSNLLGYQITKYLDYADENQLYMNMLNLDYFENMKEFFDNIIKISETRSALEREREREREDSL